MEKAHAHMVIPKRSLGKKITYFNRKTTYSNRKFDIIDGNKWPIFYRPLYILNIQYYIINRSFYIVSTQY